MWFKSLLYIGILTSSISGDQTTYTIQDGSDGRRNLTGRFLHITDFHPDWFYTPGAHLNSFCHVEPEEDGDYDQEALSRPKKDHKEARAGYWAPSPGTECDTSIQLANATFDYLKREFMHRQGGIDFVIWTGDNARHDNDNRYPRTLKQIYAANQFMVDKMQDIFGRDKYSSHFIPVVPTVGNNDVYPHNILFAGPNSKTISAYKQMWKTWVPPEQIHTFDRGAYFHISVAPKLTVVSLNSLYFYENNKAVDGCSSSQEPGTLQLDWLEIQLKLFRQQGIKIWIIGHIPPTDRQWYDGCYDRYANLVVEFRDLIVGQLFGHVNIDHFYFTKFKDSSAVRSDTVPGHMTNYASELAETSPDHVHILKNPLDVLTDARAVFDGLPQYSTKRTKSSTEAAIDAAIGHLAVVNVAPSVVPNYFPTIRLYEYLTEDITTEEQDRRDIAGQGKHNDERAQISKKRRRRKKKKKQPKRPKLPPVDSLGPAYVQRRYTPMKYTQYYLNTTQANANHNKDQVNYEVEYDTTEYPYYMADLTVGSWVTLGNEISGLQGRGKLPESSSLQNSLTKQEENSRAQDTIDTQKKKKKKKKKTPEKRHDGFWKVFMFRGFVSTGLEHEYVLDD